jgi:hypothetical protein
MASADETFVERHAVVLMVVTLVLAFAWFVTSRLEQLEQLIPVLP